MRRRVPLLLLATLAGPAAHAQGAYERHVVFDGSLTPGAYFYSSGTTTAPSELALVDGRLPVVRGRRGTPTGALRLAWTSGQGGHWYAQIRPVGWRNKVGHFEGDTLAMWVYTDAAIPRDALPDLYVADDTGQSANAMLGTLVDGLPGGRWTRLAIPLDRLGSAAGDGRRLASVAFAQRFEDERPHVLLVDEITVVGGAAESDPPPAPGGLTARGFERHVELAWGGVEAPDLRGYVVERQRDGGTFETVGVQHPAIRRWADWLGEPGRRATYRVRALDVRGNESEPSEEAEAATRPMSADELLTMVQEASFRYYWEGAHPVAGLALESIPGDPDMVAVGASGFGLMALTVGAERGFITRPELIARARQVLDYLEGADRFHGAFPHFLHGQTGRALPVFGPNDDGGDLVETAFLMQGLLALRQYLRDEPEVYARITRLWEAVEWDWYRRDPESPVLYWHWSPTVGWRIDHPLVGWNETMIVYLLAVASPTHGVPAELYHTGWAGTSERHVQYRRGWGETTDGDHYLNGRTYYGVELPVGVGPGGPMFFTHYSFLGFDPRGRRDRYADYFDNNRRIAEISRAYSTANPLGRAGYGPDAWGLTASDGPDGYVAHEAIPRRDTGTLAPTGALASFPYTPEASLVALRHFYRNLGERLWGAYGFRDAINETRGWVAPIFMGLNQAPITVMIENGRTGLVWRHFMANPEVTDALARIGFTPSPGSQP